MPEKPPRRVGTKRSKTRGLLLDATEEIMLEHGYAAVSSRQVAARAGVKAPLVHYYFPSLDDLFIALFRRRSEQSLERLSEALESERPLHAIWEFNNDPTGTPLTMEFLALANHRKAIHAELAATAEQIRRLQLEAMTRALDERGIDRDSFPPPAMLVLMTSLPRIVVLEQALGFSTGHAEAKAFVERWLERLEGKAPARRRKRPAKRARSAAGRSKENPSP